MSLPESLAPVVVAICVPIYKNPTIHTYRSMAQLWKPHGVSEHFPPGSATYMLDEHGLLIGQARMSLTGDALKMHELYPGNPQVTHVLFVDDDMLFPPHALKQLLSHGKPIVGGLCHNRRKPYNPILARKHQDDRGLEEGVMGFLYHLPPEGLVEVDATGGAFLLIERQVFDAIETKFGPLSWWKNMGESSEDFSFCARAKECGFPIYVDVGLDIGHVSEVVVDKEFARVNRPFEVNAWVSDPITVDGPPIASIIIPAYNQKPKFLRAAVLSAAHQTVPVEVIVVDDGSNPPIPLTGWPANVHVITHTTSTLVPDNRGIARALNTGIAVMSTDWFCWLSSDDLMDSRKVERQLQVLRTANGKASFHRYQAYTGNDKNGIEPYPRFAPLIQWKNMAEQKNVLAQTCAINGSTVMIHKSVFDEVGVFDWDFKYGQDWEMWCRIGQKFFWFPIDEILGTRREHGNLTEAIGESAPDDPRRLRRDAEDSAIKAKYGR